MKLTNLLPWWAKLTVKILLSRLPLRYGIWREVGLFRHGQADRVAYLQRVLHRHLKLCGMHPEDLRGKRLLELGPGDSVGTCLIASQYGASSILVDVGEYATHNLSVYERIAESVGHPIQKHVKQGQIASLKDLLREADSVYLTDGLRSLQSLKSNSVDFIFSNAVFEHVRLHEVDSVIFELARIMKPDGRMSHRVDLKDHMGGGLNNLRFSEKIWESTLIYDSGCYTNRLRSDEIIKRFESAGLKIKATEIEKWPKLPIDRRSLSAEFQILDAEALLTKGFSIFCKFERPTAHGYK